MSGAVVYEWDCETIAAEDTSEHEAEEVLDHRHGESYREVLRFSSDAPPAGCVHRVVLVRDDDAGRCWAIVEGGALPERFTDADGCAGPKVPQRFHLEVRRAR